MDYRRVGTSGLKVSAIALGAWLTYGSKRVDFENADACLRRAIELGINFIDVADIYSRGKAEETVGQVIKDYKRSDLVISTKAYWPMSDNINDRGLSRKHIVESVHKSLQRLGTDYLDIFFCHRYDDNTPVEETVRAIDDLIHQGKILYWGTSMWNAANLNEAVLTARQTNSNRPIVEQPVYNMLEREFVETGVQQAALANGMSLVVWSPLAQGVLTGKYNDGIPENTRYQSEEWFKTYLSEDKLDRTRKVSALAAELGVSSAALALAWTLKNPAVASAITGATRPEQVDQNIEALNVTLSDDLMLQLDDLLRNKPEIAKYN